MLNRPRRICNKFSPHFHFISRAGSEYEGGPNVGQGSYTRPDKHGCVVLVPHKKITLMQATVHQTSHILQVTRNTLPCITGHHVSDTIGFVPQLTFSNQTLIKIDFASILYKFNGGIVILIPIPCKCEKKFNMRKCKNARNCARNTNFRNTQRLHTFFFRTTIQKFVQ